VSTRVQIAEAGGRSGLRLTVFRFVHADEVIKVICMGGLGTN
jgi:hypothetical protein